MIDMAKLITNFPTGLEIVDQFQFRCSKGKGFHFAKVTRYTKMVQVWIGMILILSLIWSTKGIDLLDDLLFWSVYNILIYRCLNAIGTQIYCVLFHLLLPHPRVKPHLKILLELLIAFLCRIPSQSSPILRRLQMTADALGQEVLTCHLVKHCSSTPHQPTKVVGKIPLKPNLMKLKHPQGIFSSS